MKNIMKRLVIFSFALLMIFSMTACGGEKKVTINVYNWGDYIDESVLSEFEEKYGVNVNYEMYDSTKY